MSVPYPLVPLSSILSERKEKPTPDALLAGETRIVEKISFNDGRIHLREDGATKTSMILIRPGDLVVSGINAAKGAIAVYGEDNALPAAATIHYGAYKPDQERTDVRYLWWLLRSRTFRDLLLKHVPGGIKTELKAKRLLPVPVPLPSLPEQQRIVVRIEELVAKIEEARALRRLAVEEVEIFSTAAYSSAYDEATKFADGVDKLGNLCTRITDGAHATPTYVAEGVPFLSVKDITTGTIKFDESRFITPEEHAVLTKRCKPERDDVLLTKIGTTGFAKVVDVDREFSIFVSLALLKLDRSRLDPKFTEYMLNSTKLREYSANGTRGVGNKNLVLKFIREFPMPAPSLRDQQRIVDHLDGLQAQVASLKQLQSDTATELDALLPSVLDRAFKGKL